MPQHPQDTSTLSDGAEMAVIGFGVRQVPRDRTADCVYQAIKYGYRSIDTAAAYRNERQGRRRHPARHRLREVGPRGAHPGQS